MAAPVLAAVDPASPDMAPARFGARVAAYLDAPLVITAVYADGAAVGVLAGGQLGEELSRDAQEVLDRVADELAGTGGRPDILATGAASAPRGLELAVQQLGPALLVIGSAAGAEPGRATAGSTGQRLLNGSPGPVALVPPGWEDGDGFASVGAGFVDTVDGHEALDGAHAIASRAGATLRVLAAVQPRSWMDGDPDLRTAAEQAAGAAIADLVGEPIDVDVEVREPADLLLEASSELDLLVCGSRGYGPRPAVLLGGVTRQLTAGARCPVIVLAGGARPGLAP